MIEHHYHVGMDDQIRQHMREMGRKRWAGSTAEERRAALAHARAVRDTPEYRAATGRRLTAARAAARQRRAAEQDS